MAKNNGIKIAVLGLGKSGIACANLAISKGYSVFASDSGKVRTHKQMNLNKKKYISKVKKYNSALWSRANRKGKIRD